MTFRTTILAALAAFLLSTPAYAVSEGDAQAAYCREHLAVCAPAAEAHASTAQEAVIAEVFRRVNDHFVPQLNLDGSGKTRELWYVMSKEHPTGDCVDFSLTYRDELIKAGVPAGAIALVFFKVPTDPKENDTHMVVMVRTETNILYLDVLHPTNVLHESPERMLGYKALFVTSWGAIEDWKRAPQDLAMLDMSPEALALFKK